ncbi:MAG: hypothetical protein ABIG89_06945 [Candidatus Woesearchaeota archaeon]
MAFDRNRLEEITKKINASSEPLDLEDDELEILVRAATEISIASKAIKKLEFSDDDLYQVFRLYASKKRYEDILIKIGRPTIKSSKSYMTHLFTRLGLRRNPGSVVRADASTINGLIEYSMSKHQELIDHLNTTGKTEATLAYINGSLKKKLVTAIVNHDLFKKEEGNWCQHLEALLRETVVRLDSKQGDKLPRKKSERRYDAVEAVYAFYEVIIEKRYPINRENMVNEAVFKFPDLDWKMLESLAGTAFEASDKVYINGIEYVKERTYKKQVYAALRTIKDIDQNIFLDEEFDRTESRDLIKSVYPGNPQNHIVDDILSSAYPVDGNDAIYTRNNLLIAMFMYLRRLGERVDDSIYGNLDHTYLLRIKKENDYLSLTYEEDQILKKADERIAKGFKPESLSYERFIN